MSKPDLWDRDDVQFARLLAEIRAVGLTAEQTAALKESTDCDTDAICEIMSRAEEVYEGLKDDLVAGRLEPLYKPLSIEQIKEQYERDASVAGVVRVCLNDLFEINFEGFLDMLSEKLTGTDILENIDYEVVGVEHGSTLLIRVDGDPKGILETAGEP